MGKLHDRAGEELTILAVNIGVRQSIEKLKRYVKKNDIEYTVLFDEKTEVCRDYQVRGIPTFIRVDPEGVITYRGYTMPPEFVRMIE